MIDKIIEKGIEKGKKIFNIVSLVLFILLLLAGIALAGNIVVKNGQLNVSDNVIATSSGSLGIGTTAPGHKLVVIGNVNISGTLNASTINTTTLGAGVLKGPVDCGYITGGSDSDYCADATGGGGGAEKNETPFYNETAKSQIVVRNYFLSYLLNFSSSIMTLLRLNATSINVTDINAANVTSVTMNATSKIGSTRFEGRIDCGYIDGGSDSDYCTDVGADGAPNAISTNDTSQNKTGNLTLNNLFVGLKTILSGIPYIWPSADGSSAQLLSTNGTGGLSWISIGTTAVTLAGNLTGTNASAKLTSNSVSSDNIVDGSIKNADLTETGTFLNTSANSQTKSGSLLIGTDVNVTGRVNASLVVATNVTSTVVNGTNVGANTFYGALACGYITGATSDLCTLVDNSFNGKLVWNASDTSITQNDTRLSVGIGTFVPSHKLTITANDSNASEVRNVLALDHFNANLTNGTAGIGTGILFRTVDAIGDIENISSIQAVLTNAANTSEASAFTISTRTAGSGLNERVRVDGSGNLGVNATNPRSTLEVNGKVNVSGYITAGENVVLTNNSGHGGNVTGTNNSLKLVDASVSDQNIVGAGTFLRTNATTQTKTGNLVLGGDVNVTYLVNATIVKAGNVTATVLNGTSTGATTFYGALACGYVTGATSDLCTLVDNNASFKIVWNASDTSITQNDTRLSVGIGTLVPTHKLTVAVNDSNASEVRNVLALDHFNANLTNGTVGIGTGILFRTVDSIGDIENISSIQAVLTNAANTSEASAFTISTRTAGSGLNERVRVDGSGNLGVNTTTPRSTLEVNGKVNVTGYITVGENIVLTNNSAFGGNVTGTNNSLKLTANSVSPDNVVFNYAGGQTKGGIATDSALFDGLGQSSYLMTNDTSQNKTGNLTLNNLFVGLKTILSGIPYIWPAADGSNSQVLSTNGTGGLSWISIGTTAVTLAGNLTGTNTSGKLAAASVSEQNIVDTGTFLRTNATNQTKSGALFVDSLTAAKKVNATGLEAINVTTASSNITTAGVGVLKGPVDCGYITGGSDADYCVDATGGGGGAEKNETPFYNETAKSQIVVRNYFLAYLLNLSSSLMTLSRLNVTSINATDINAANVTSININATGTSSANRFNGRINCGYIDGGSDADYCADATGAGGGSTGTSFSNFTYLDAYFNTSNAVNYFKIQNLTVPLPSTGSTVIECLLQQSAGAATTGVQYQVNISGSSLTLFDFRYMSSATAVALCGGKVSNFTCAAIASGGLVLTPTELWAYTKRNVAGNLTIAVKSEVAASVVNVSAGSYCRSFNVNP